MDQRLQLDKALELLRAGVAPHVMKNLRAQNLNPIMLWQHTVMDFLEEVAQGARPEPQAEVAKNE